MVKIDELVFVRHGLQIRASRGTPPESWLKAGIFHVTSLMTPTGSHVYRKQYNELQSTPEGSHVFKNHNG